MRCSGKDLHEAVGAPPRAEAATQVKHIAMENEEKVI